MNGIIKGMKSMFSAEGIGSMVAIIIILGVVTAFAPTWSPDGIAGRVKRS